MQERGRKSAATLAVAIVVALFAGAGVAWATLTVLRPADDPLDSVAWATVEVMPGEVGSSLSLNARTEWVAEPQGSNQASGVVTEVFVEPGDDVTAGTRLYSVDLRPVVIAAWSIPAFRDIGEGASGADVTQLQDFFRELGYFTGESTGTVRWSTIEAIMAWQRSLGLAETGVVQRGDVVFVNTLPARVVLDGDLVARGKTLSGGEDVVSVLGSAPSFVMSTTQEQSRMIADGTTIEVTSPSGIVWPAVAQERDVNPESGSIDITLTAPDGGVLCGDACAELSVTGSSFVPARAIVIPTVTGLVVPSSALVTTADGEIVLVDEAGGRRTITVIASARGMSVIEGVEDGFRARVPGDGT